MVAQAVQRFAAGAVCLRQREGQPEASAEHPLEAVRREAEPGFRRERSQRAGCAWALLREAECAVGL